MSAVNAEMSVHEAAEYFESIGKGGPVGLEDNPVRAKRWEFLTENMERDLKLENSYVGKAPPSAASVRWCRANTEILLENELWRICLDEVKDRNLLRKSPEDIFEEIDTSAVSPFVRFSLPVIRRVTPRTYARSLVNVQAMPQPSGKIFFIDVKYGESKAPTVAGDRVDLVSTFNSRYAGGSPTLLITAAGGQTDFNMEDGSTSGHQVFADGAPQTGGGVDYTVSVGTGPAGVDQIIFGGAPGAGVEVTIIYDNYAEGNTARDIDVVMSDTTIEAEEWALKGTMTVQTMQDFQSQHGLSMEQEITSAISGEIDREIDFTILDRLLKGATGGNTNWDSAGFLAGDITTTAQRDYKKTLYEAIISTANLIYRKRFLNPTWIVGGVGAVERLEKLEEFKLSSNPNSPDDAQVDRIYEGTLAGKYQVFKDARMPDDKFLMGYKGSSPFHSGATFAPYIPAFMTDMIMDPAINFKVRKGLLSRNGFKITLPDVYGTVTIL